MQNITIGEIATAVGFIVTLSGGIGAIIGWILSPIKKQKDADALMDKRVEMVEEHLDNDNKRLNKLENDTKEILKCLNVMLSHMVNGNDIDKLKKRKAELEAYLINEH